MINYKTVLILGAGASKPYGFPTAGELLEEICESLKQPNSELFQNLLGCSFNEDMILDFRNELFLSMQPSVDFFIESRTEYIEIGKAAIAGCLIQYENSEKLSRNQSGHWYRYLFEQMRTTVNDFHKNKLSIITFNYDRSIEHFFITALKNSYKLNDIEACNILNKFSIIHLYGKLGGYPNLDDEDIRCFNSEINPDIIMKAAKGIKLMNERAFQSDQICKAQDIIKDSKVICFLGFGYHPINFDNFIKKVKEDLGGNWNWRTYYGSAFGIKDGERRRILNMFSNIIKLGDENDSLLDYLRSNQIFPQKI